VKKKIKVIQSPVLFIHGTSDEVIPFQHSKILFSLCPSQKKVLHLAKGATHNEFDEEKDVFLPIDSWLNINVLKKKRLSKTLLKKKGKKHKNKISDKEKSETKEAKEKKRIDDILKPFFIRKSIKSSVWK